MSGETGKKVRWARTILRLTEHLLSVRHHLNSDSVPIPRNVGCGYPIFQGKKLRHKRESSLPRVTWPVSGTTRSAPGSPAPEPPCCQLRSFNCRQMRFWRLESILFLLTSVHKSSGMSVRWVRTLALWSDPILAGSSECHFPSKLPMAPLYNRVGVLALLSWLLWGLTGSLPRKHLMHHT